MLGLALDSLTDELISTDSNGDDPRYELVQKIRSSMAEIGTNHGSWDEVVEAYTRMRAFSIDDNPDFELRLDHIVDTDGWGKTRHAKICVDGVFAFFLYYKRRHILTIGFSIASGRRVLIGNVQAPKESKGWGLQFLPRERLEYVIELFQKTFEGYEIYLVHAEDLIERLLKDYERELQAAQQDRDNAATEEECEMGTKWVQEFERCIGHLQNDRPRLIERYNKVGRFILGSISHFNGLRYYKL